MVSALPGPGTRSHAHSAAVRRVLAAVLISFSLIACHEEGTVKVKSLSFDGNAAFEDDRLKAILATRTSGWLPWSARHYFDRSEFDADLRRITAFYADRGYPKARVAGVKVDLTAAKDAVALTVSIDEGPPLLVESVQTTGFDVLPEGVLGELSTLQSQKDKPRDRDAVRSGRDYAARLLREHGFARGEVEVGETLGAGPERVVLTYAATPGPRMTFGEVTVTGLERVSEKVIRRELAFQPGELYRQSLVNKSQRRLSALQLFDLANIDDRLADSSSVTTVPIRITVAEGFPRRLQLGIGYGTEEHARATLKWTHLNWLGGARVADVDAKYSAIDRGLTLSVSQPHFYKAGLSLQMSASGWHTQALSYSSDSYGGRAGLVYRIERPAVDAKRYPVRYEFRSAYSNEYLRYGIKEDALDDLDRREERIALGLDPDTGRASGTLASINLEAERVAVDVPLNPTRGTILSAQLNHAAPWLGGTYQFDEIVTEARGYLPVARNVVIASRVRFGTLAAADPLKVPFSSRYFIGGSNSMRGWGRFQVSPLDDEGLPVGGRSQFELSAEARFPVRGPVGAVVFFDAGHVWREEWEVHFDELRWDVGAGIRYRTPIGAVRGDFGYQLNPLEGLVINGKLQERRWRVHFSIGQAF
jgi:outer membrane protein assembly complex protein YaeT